MIDFVLTICAGAALCFAFLLWLGIIVLATHAHRRERPPTVGERAAYVDLLREIETGRDARGAWYYSERFRCYVPASSAREIHAAAEEFGGSVRVVRWDDELNRFVEEVVTDKMPEREIGI